METYFPYIIDYEFTANMEKKLDDIANGKISKIQVMGSFYKQLMEEINKISGQKLEKITINSDKLIGKNDQNNQEILGTLNLIDLAGIYKKD